MEVVTRRYILEVERLRGSRRGCLVEQEIEVSIWANADEIGEIEITAGRQDGGRERWFCAEDYPEVYKSKAILRAVHRLVEEDRWAIQQEAEDIAGDRDVDLAIETQLESRMVERKRLRGNDI